MSYVTMILSISFGQCPRNVYAVVGWVLELRYSQFCISLTKHLLINVYTILIHIHVCVQIHSCNGYNGVNFCACTISECQNYLVVSELKFADVFQGNKIFYGSSGFS